MREEDVTRSKKQERLPSVNKLYSFESEIGILLSEEDRTDIERIWKVWTGRNEAFPDIRYNLCFIARANVAVDGRHPVVGLMTLKHLQGPGNKGFLANLVVDTGHRGQGIAHELFRNAIASARKSKLEILEAERDLIIEDGIDKSLTSKAARKIHKELGFTVIETRRVTHGENFRETERIALRL